MRELIFILNEYGFSLLAHEPFFVGVIALPAKIQLSSPPQSVFCIFLLFPPRGYDEWIFVFFRSSLFYPPQNLKMLNVALV